MAEILKGAPVAAALTEKLIEQADGLKAKGIVPTLAIIRVGENPGDISYETGAVKRCEKIGIDVKKFILPDASKVLDTIKNINDDKNIHGCLMLRPLPDKNIEKAACEILCHEKDVDCMTEKSLAKIFTGSPGFAPCTAQACMELLDFYGVELEGKSVAVIGRSLVIGKPVSMLLQNKNATVTMCHSRTKNLAEVCRNSEIIIAAIGKANFIDKNFAASGQIIIDVGINLSPDGKLCGDVNFSEAEPIVKAITPVPAGVGAVTTAVLAKHVIEAALVMIK
ncbi:MAG: tetrahydrofolate dehydrogenase/cyclohydrolase catalytic domain-containing protein [Synergistales bacterium]|nr:tetrahydrofolate dehydrogenase/cyclohydrolase catalytic domain-containing protein [Synergistales bacterium]MDY6401376.1 tetrahydrofolate dehydrogenase/cyclohydrolase catalytic domain-containing protein [Synergistales bacterium]MDY6405051.1 tetrahydrofolate dehydrogenase/cyclohydrolase catalytic domain-containing protein [Synergistales bacterium]MDY6410122.1 tetrahydrofolate dehydrogenase/cyclohydrolase catalytic domain-containing protein [Synergistales bacterium]MDY6413910.1 tetrahydrofolate